MYIPIFWHKFSLILEVFIYSHGTKRVESWANFTKTKQKKKKKKKKKKADNEQIPDKTFPAKSYRKARLNYGMGITSRLFD